MPGEGVSLGAARGTIIIDTSSVTAAVPVVAAASAAMTNSLGGVGKGGAQAQSGLAGLLGTSKQLAGAFGYGAGIAGAVVAGKQLLQFGLDSIQAASDLTESQNKISVAFAGSRKAVLDWSKNSATALGQSQRQALEGASSFGLLFRTMGLGAGTSAEMSEKLVQLAADLASINNISPEEALLKLRSGLVGEAEPLRQVGVLLDETTVKNKAMEMGLATSEAALTQQDKVMARYQLILEQTALSQGDFARTSGELANQQRTLAGNIENSEAAIGKLLKPLAGGAIQIANAYIEQQMVLLAGWETDITAVADEWIKLNRLLGIDLGLTSAQVARITKPSERTGIGSNIRQRPVALDSAPLTPEQQVHIDWAQGIEDLNKQTHDAINDEEDSFGQSRAKTVADYNKSVSRDEAAYARGRLRQNMDFLDALAGVGKDATRREQGAAADLARTQGKARSDSAEREVNIRDDANKRLVKLDADYEKNRLKAAQDLSDNLLDAAGDLDAKQVYELQRDAAKQQQEASEAHDDARKEIADGLQERLDDERKSLAKSLKQQQDSYDRQIEEGRENDRIRIQDMKDAFTKSQAQEAEDHRIRVDERAEDQAAQLTEMDTQHGLRLNQIRSHAIEERTALQQAADDALVAAKVADEATRKRVDDKEKHLEDLWDKFHKHIEDSIKPGAPGTPGIAATVGSPRGYADGGPVRSTGPIFAHAGEYVLSRAMLASMPIPMPTASSSMSTPNSRSIHVGAIHPTIVIGDAGRRSDAEITDMVVRGLTKALEDAAGL